MFSSNRKFMYTACLMFFFWSLFDGVVSYITPLKISQSGFSNTILGIILGTSSVAGCVFDFLLSKYFKNMHFRRVYLIMFAACFAYPLIIWQAKSIWLFFIAMAIWGLYYDLINFGSYDFVSRRFEKNDHSSNFGLITIFKQLGYVLAPLIVGLMLGSMSFVDFKPILLMIIFLTTSFSFYLILRHGSIFKTKEYIDGTPHKYLSFLEEFSLWKKIGTILMPVLIVTVFINIFDSFFWTLGPILAESYKQLHPFNGLFLTAYTLPSLFIGLFIGSVTKKFGKKRTAFIGFGIGSLILSLFFTLHSPILILLDILIASFFVSFAFPSIAGAYADYISESGLVEREVEGIGDFSSNVGYVIGPIFAGFLSDKIGNAQTFTILGLTCAFVALFALITTPRKINLNTDNLNFKK